MGNNLSSFLSLDNLNIVETKYWKIYDIPYLSINKKELKLDPKKDDSFAIVHISNATQYEKTVKKIADSLPVKVYVLPSQDSQ